MDAHPQLGAVLAHFPGIDDSVGAPQKPAHAAIAQVWLLDNQYVLRARTHVQGIEAAFHREQRLLEQVRPMLPYSLPVPLPADTGERYVLHADCLWTLHPQLPGRVICPWQQLHRAPVQDHRRLVRALHQLHDATRGRLSGPDWQWLVRDVSTRLDGVRELVSPTANRRVELALRRIREFSTAFTADDSCFVHGDYHWGNLLVDDRDKITGLLDLDWCRVAHPLEDLAYTAMMLLRDYDTGGPRLDALARILDWYGVAPGDKALLDEYLILYTLFDVHLFESTLGLAGGDVFLQHQLELLERLCADVSPDVG